ncbi:hypothetical protein CGZ80_14310 [Rhodopirellula sp. MGV]|nr:hypothetical protein CGZ80_14310 [Rhodopirellula sp. MGV]
MRSAHGVTAKWMKDQSPRQQQFAGVQSRLVCSGSFYWAAENLDVANPASRTAFPRSVVTTANW